MCFLNDKEVERMTTCRRGVLIGIASSVCILPGILLAQSDAVYPVKPIRIIVPSVAGGGDDFAARVMGAKLSELLGQQVVIENRPGAGGMIGQSFVAKAAPDGYTLLLAGGSMAGARFVNANVSYDLQRDFSPVSLIEIAPFAMLVNPALPVRNIKDLIALAHSKPGKLSFGTIGAGQIPYWAAMLFNRMAGIDALEVAYKTTSDAVIDVIAGRLDYTFVAVSQGVTSKDKARILAVTGAERSPALPDVPTMAEAALPGYEMTAWRSIMGPVGLPANVVSRLNRAIGEAMVASEVKEKYQSAGSVPATGTPQELKKRYQDWEAIFGRIAKDAGLKPQ
jgi:tripartite-type tricarboxylate transporter receptor subunit TctC